MPALKYHQATFDMIGRTPVFSQAASDALDERERVLGITFPASVREWFSLEGVSEIIDYYSNDDYLFKVDELGQESVWYNEDRFNKSEAQGDKIHQKYKLVSFISENQAVFWAFFQVDGSDDPPVLFWDDDEIWRSVNAHFSDFLYGWIWGFLYLRSPYKLVGRSNIPSQADLDFLRTNLEEAKYSREDSYCFESSGQRLEIDCSKDSAKWILEAGTADKLVDLAKTLINYPTFGYDKFISIFQCPDRFNKECREVLQHLVNEHS